MPILLAIAMPLLFLFRGFKIKDWRRVGVGPFSSAAAGSFLALPMFIAILFYTVAFSKGIVFTQSWVLGALAWVAIATSTNILSIWIFKHISFTQFGALSRVFAFIFSILSDIFIFKIDFPIMSILFLFMILLGGVEIKDKSIAKNKKAHKHPIWRLVGIVIIIQALVAMQIILFKHLAIIQTDMLFLAAFFQTMIFSSFLVLGIKPAIKDIKSGKIKIADIIYTNFLIIIFCLMEPHVLKALPIVVITSLGVVSIAFSYLYDLKSNDLHKDKHSLFYLAIIFLGVIGLVVVQH
jgi:hypothetical protein